MSTATTSPETRSELAAERSRRPRPTTPRSPRWFAPASTARSSSRSVREGHRPRVRREPAPAAAYYRERGARSHLLSRVEQLGGRELSYNNLADLEGARRAARASRSPAAVIVKHGDPCGVAVAATIEEAWERALAADPVSAFGWSPCSTARSTRRSASGSRSSSSRCCLAPGFDDDALDALRAKQALRILADHERRARHARRARLHARARRPARPGP